MNLEIKKYFEQVSVDDELPDHTNYVHVIEEGDPMIAYGNWKKRRNKEPFFDWKENISECGGGVSPSHWLKPTEGILLSKEDLIELLGKAHHNGFLHGKFHEFIESKFPTNSEQINDTNATT